jgi:glycosyltransferase involved in cell wall biosynthesis
MHSARAFVQHSIRPGDGDSEGTPVAILEAGMSGLPVVSTRHAGIKDVVIHNETGFLVDEGDIDGMAACMLLLARDAAQAATLGARAHHHIRTNFSMDQHIARLSAILEQAHTPTKEQQP